MNITTEAETSSKTGLFAGLCLVTVVAAIILAMVVGGADDQDSSGVIAEAARIPTTGTVRQASFAEAVGSALPRLDASLGQDPAIGMAAPSVTASYFDNAEVTIDFADGQPRVVFFFAHWCPHCQEEVKELVQYFEQEGISDAVEIVAISTNIDQGAPNYPPSQWFLRERWPLPVLRDSANNDLAAGFGLSGFPFTVVVDADGEVVIRQSGLLPASERNRLLDLAGGPR